MPQATIILAALLALHSTIIVLNAGRSPLRAPARLQAPARQANKEGADGAVNRTRALTEEIIAASYPELKGTDIRIKSFRSRSDYFKARFGLPQYFFAHMRYLLFVNPRVFELHAPDAGVRAIIAHELGHALSFKLRNRVRPFGTRASQVEAIHRRV